jgi:hypothetical protein
LADLLKLILIASNQVSEHLRMFEYLLGDARWNAMCQQKQLSLITSKHIDQSMDQGFGCCPVKVEATSFNLAQIRKADSN